MPTRAIACPHWERPSTAEIRGIAVWHGRDVHGDPVNPPVEYALIQCARCDDAALQIREDYGGGFDEDNPIIVYPRRRQLSWSVPEPLRREWQEAVTCFEAKAYAACLVMVRRTLEGTCMEHGVRERTLLHGLKQLESQGLIDGFLARWADALRVAGNEGAHYTGRAVPREDAEDALDFGEALLDHVYVLRKRFEEFQKRLAKRREPVDVEVIDDDPET
jgi:hypothetical protein